MRHSPVPRSHALLGAVSLLFALACASGSSKPGGGGGVDSEGGDFAEFADATVTCDPTADLWDDLFYFEAETVGEVYGVSVEVFEGASLIGRVDLTERSAGDWYGESWADDLGSDCDSWQRMLFEFVGDVQGGREIRATVEP
ncbi:MAG: hypothetical protein H6741_34310 [Alphaproteobacteria bacterium]|nr:hypothetical protein [Alphaproteobacteria bacterium]